MGEVIELQQIIQCGSCGNTNFMIVDDGDIICLACETMCLDMRVVFNDDIEIELDA